MIQELVKEAMTGEEAAWNALYKLYYPDLYATALRIYRNTPAAKDAVQEAFIIAYLKLSQIRETATFGGWIKKILLHYCYRDLQRNPLSQRTYTLPVESDSWWEDELNNKLEAVFKQSRLYTALAYLPEVLRSTLLLRYFSGFQSYEQIAAILSVPVGTVRSRLNQAKLKLTEYWDRHPDAASTMFRESEQWNEFYQTTYSRLHSQDNYKNTFINHLQKDVQIILAGHKIVLGNTFFDKKVADDRQVGSWLTTANVTSCGNISVIEANHYNSPEHPFHCPAQSVAVLYRNKATVSNMFLYTSTL